MTKRHLTILAGLLASASFEMPAYADPTPSSYTDGYTLAERDREHGFPARVVTAATPMQQAVLAISPSARAASATATPRAIGRSARAPNCRI